MIASGTRLGPYEVLSSLGAGGMGEVWRARDTRLAREAAIKVLPSEVAADAGRLKRFEKEARAASALNHPNIVTIYDIGSSNSVSWIAMERVEGKTLREVLFGGPLPIKRLLQVATQIAEGLARAHEAGIVHRDLKPENVMVTKDGLVKILDFGLAKLTESSSGSDEASHLPTETGTSPGVVLGTVGYMSPEQAAGQLVDFRSDQFSFGSILYEMATGKRAFQKGTAVDTLSAILHEEPKPVAQINPEAPAPLRWIVERCLAKDPEGRYASTKDLSRELETVRDRLSEASVSGAAPTAATSPVPRRLRAGTLWFVLLVAAVAGLFGGKALWISPPSIPSFQQITFRRGVTWYARFAPDGHTIVYSAAWDGNPYELYTTRVGGPESRPLGLSPANILSISSSGQMAIQLLNESSTLAEVPLAGGAPRELLEGVSEADWSPDGKSLAVVHHVAGRARLEFPVGKVLYETPNEIGSVRISPRGDLLAFAEGRRLRVMDPAGKIRGAPVTSGAADLVWSRDGSEIWFLREHRGRSEMEVRAVTLSGRERLVARLPGDFRLYDMSPRGQLLTERVMGRVEMFALTPGEKRERPLSWLADGVPAGLSADGKTVLISSFFRKEAYLRRTDGSPAGRLGAGLALALSPDGKWALVAEDDAVAPARLTLLPTGPGQPSALELEGIVFRGNRYGGAAFFPDGRKILLTAEQPGHRPRLYVLPVEGGKPRPVTPEGVSALPLGSDPISPDGKLVGVVADDGKLYLYDAGGESVSPRPIPGLSGGERLLRWSAEAQALFVEEHRGAFNRVYRFDLLTAEKRLWKEFTSADPAGVLGAPNVLLTPAGDSWVYGYWRDLSDLYLVDGLR